MIKSRKQFIEYIMMRLGEPITKVNVTKQQVDYCIDDALNYWHQYHHEGTMRTLLKQIVTPSTILIDNAENIPQHSLCGTIVGEQSKAKATVLNNLSYHSNSNVLYVYKIRGDFIRGETIKFNDYQCNIADVDNPVKKGIYDTGIIEVPEFITGIREIIAPNNGHSSSNLFDMQYQLRLNDLYDLTSTSLIYYDQTMRHIDLLQYELTARPSFTFNQYSGELVIDCTWGIDYTVGDYVIIDAYRAIDPQKYFKIWNEPWLKEYAYNLVKRQYGTNLKKYSGMTLPGGVTFNGDQIYSEAQDAITHLEEEIQNLIQPSCFMVG